MYTRTMENKYGLTETLWDELSLAARFHFNQQYEAMCKYCELMCHPKMKPIGQKYWHIIAFNSAYLAACIYDGKDLPTVLPEEDFPLQPPQ